MAVHDGGWGRLLLRRDLAPAREGWPEAFAVLTTAANPDVEFCNDRQMAVIPRGSHMDWLDHRVPEGELLRPLPAGTFRRHQVR